MDLLNYVNFFLIMNEFTSIYIDALGKLSISYNNCAQLEVTTLPQVSVHGANMCALDLHDR